MNFKLSAKTRDSKTGGDLNKIRENYGLPAVVYGHGVGNQSVSIDYNKFVKLFSQAGTSSIIELSVEGGKEAVPVIVSEIQKDPVTDRFIHVDLHAIRMDETIKTDIALNFIGESPAVKEQGGNLIINRDSLHIECLPKDLVQSIDIDLSKITEIDQAIHVNDLKVPEGITILEEADTSLVTVLAPRIEKVSVEETAEGGEEGAEGEAGAEGEGSEEKKEGGDDAAPEKKAE